MIVLHPQANAESAVREMLCSFSEAQGLPEVGTVYAEDQMDDGMRHACSLWLYTVFLVVLLTAVPHLQEPPSSWQSPLTAGTAAHCSTFKAQDLRCMEISMHPLL